MIEDVRHDAAGLGDFVEFAPAGDVGDGDYRCADCRYGISVHGELPRCPMCGGAVWEPTGVPVAVDEPLRPA